jgi:putative oxidoreductase
MHKLLCLARRYYEVLVLGANSLRSPLLLFLRVYFFWQLFLTGIGKLSNIGKISEYFTSLGIPWPTLNAYLAGSAETFCGLFLIFGIASRLAAIPVLFTMIVAYLTADQEAVTSMLSNSDKFVKADPFPFLLLAFIVFVFGPGQLSLDALFERKLWPVRERNRIASSLIE